MNGVHVFLSGKGELRGTHHTGSPCKRSSTARTANKPSICTDDKTLKLCVPSVSSVFVIRVHLNNAVMYFSKSH